MTGDVYIKLREQLDQYSIGFPATASGIEMRILQRLFSEDEAELFLQLTLILENPEAVAARLNRDAGAVADLLERMAEKGLVFRLERGGVRKYAAVPFVVGSFEFQLKTMDRELAEMLEQYIEESYAAAFTEVNPPMRPIPINRSLKVSHPVATYNDSRAIVKKQKKIVLADCICRTQQELLDKACGKPTEVCMIFGAHAEYYLSREMGREIDVDEAMAVLDRAEEAGLVTQPYNAQNPGGLCNCCGDCCGILRALNKLPRPVDAVISNYFAVIDAEACVGCEVCLDRCQMSAIAMNDDGVAEIDRDRCIGCGLCVTTCAAEAMGLELKPEAEHREPPENGMVQMMELAEKRGKTLTPLSMTES